MGSYQTYIIVHGHRFIVNRCCRQCHAPFHLSLCQAFQRTTTLERVQQNRIGTSLAYYNVCKADPISVFCSVALSK